MIASIAYAILRYRFLDIQIIIKRSLIYLFLYLFLSLSYITTVVFIRGWITGTQGQVTTGDIVLLFVVATSSPILVGLFDRLTDKLFFRARYDTQQTMLELSKNLSSLVSLHQLDEKIADTLMATMKLSGLAIVRQGPEEGTPYQVSLQREMGKIPKALLGHKELAHHFSTRPEILITEEIERQLSETDHPDKALHSLIAGFRKQGIEAVIPLLSKQKLIGFLFLKAKRSGDAFTNQDIKLLDLLSHNAAVAMDNALLYQDLEHRIELRTREVNEKNTYLITLQRVMNQIIQAADLSQLFQNIVDAIHHEMGYPGAYIINYEPIVDEDMRLVAISDTPEIKQAMQTLGRDAYKILGHAEDNPISHRVIKDREVVSYDHFRDMVSPSIPVKVADKMQHDAGIRGFVAVPIVVEEQTYGALVFMLHKTRKALSPAELEIMQALSHMVAIVIRNSHYYEEIQESNKKLQNAYKMINQQLGQLEEANVHLQQLDKAKTEFLSIASHQLRTPLSAIRGYLSLLEEGDFGPVPDGQVKVLQKTQENVKRLVALVNDLLSLARIEAGSGPKNINLVETNFVELIEQVVEEVALVAKKKNIELVWTAPKAAVNVPLDREKMEQVVMNLIDNAVHYTPEGSVTVGLEDKAKSIVFSVKDTGIGMDKEAQNNLFSKFYRSPEAIRVRPDGTGIGLYVVKVMIESHKGRIWVESEAGKGTTFFVELQKKLG